HAATRLGGAGGGAKAQRLLFELEELLGVDLTAFALDALEDTPLGGRELVDLLGELAGVAEDLPRELEGERDRRRRRTPPVMGGDGARRLERRPGQKCTNPAWVLALPGPKLNEVGRGQDELDRAALAAREHQTAPQKRFERRWDRLDDERAPRLRDAVKELDARRR